MNKGSAHNSRKDIDFDKIQNTLIRALGRKEYEIYYYNNNRFYFSKEKGKGFEGNISKL